MLGSKISKIWEVLLPSKRIADLLIAMKEFSSEMYPRCLEKLQRLLKVSVRQRYTNEANSWDNFHGKFDELVFSHVHNCMLGVKAEGSDSSVFKISLDGQLSKFKYRTGPLVVGKKLSLGIFENYLAVQRDDVSFEVLGGLDQKLGFVVDRPIVISTELMGKIVCVKLYLMKHLVVFGENGATLFYEILNNCRIKEAHQKKN